MNGTLGVGGGEERRNLDSKHIWNLDFNIITKPSKFVIGLGIAWSFQLVTNEGGTLNKLGLGFRVYTPFMVLV